MFDRVAVRPTPIHAGVVDVISVGCCWRSGQVGQLLSQKRRRLRPNVGMSRPVWSVTNLLYAIETATPQFVTVSALLYLWLHTSEQQHLLSHH